MSIGTNISTSVDTTRAARSADNNLCARITTGLARSARRIGAAVMTPINMLRELFSTEGVAERGRFLYSGRQAAYEELTCRRNATTVAAQPDSVMTGVNEAASQGYLVSSQMSTVLVAQAHSVNEAASQVHLVSSQMSTTTEENTPAQQESQNPSVDALQAELEVAHETNIDANQDEDSIFDTDLTSVICEMIAEEESVNTWVEEESGIAGYKQYMGEPVQQAVQQAVQEVEQQAEQEVQNQENALPQALATARHKIRLARKLPADTREKRATRRSLIREAVLSIEAHVGQRVRLPLKIIQAENKIDKARKLPANTPQQRVERRSAIREASLQLEALLARR